MSNTRKVKVNKVTEKQTEEQPIALDVHLSKSEAFIEKNLKPILIGLVAVIVIVAGIFIWKNHMKKVEVEAQVAIRTSQTLFAQQQWENALNGDGVNVGFLRVIDEYSGTKTANLAKLYAAICYANTEKYDEAIKMFEGFSPAGDLLVSPSAVAALGNCYAEKGDAAKGAKVLEEAAKSADNDAVSPVFMVQAANLYKSLNQNDKAIQLYQNVKTKYPRSPLSSQMDKYIEELSK